MVELVTLCTLQSHSEPTHKTSASKIVRSQATSPVPLLISLCSGGGGGGVRQMLRTIERVTRNKGRGGYKGEEGNKYD